MANNPLPYTQPSLIDYERQLCNGQLANAGTLRAIAQSFNHSAGVRKKVLGGVVAPASTGSGATSTTATHGYGRFRTGPATTSLMFRVGLYPTGSKIGTRLPAIWLTLNGSAQQEVAASSTGGTTLSADALSHRQIVITVTANTEYYWTVEGRDGARLVYATIFEGRDNTINPSNNGMVDPAPYVVGADLDEDYISDLIDANNALIQQGGAHLLQHMTQKPNQLTVTSTSYVSLFPNSTCLPWIQWENMNTRARDLDVVWWTNAGVSTTATTSIRLVTSPGGTVIADNTTHGTSQTWESTASTIDTSAAAGSYVDVQAKTSTGTLTVYSWSLYPYDA